MENKMKLSQEDIMKLLNSCYEKATNGISKISPPIDQFAEDYLQKHNTPQEAAKDMLKKQIIKLHNFGSINRIWRGDNIACNHSCKYWQCSLCANENDSVHSLHGRI